MGSSPSYGADYAQATQEAQQAWQKSALKQLDTMFSGYNDAFYHKAADSWVKANEPQFQQQASRTQDQLGFKLANQGLLKSSAGQKLGNLLQREITSQQQSLAERGQGYADNLARQIAGYKNSVASQIQTAPNPGAALSTAMSSAPAYTQSTIASGMLPNMFGNFAQQYLLSNIAPSMVSGSLYTSPGGGGGGLPSTETIGGN